MKPGRPKKYEETMKRVPQLLSRDEINRLEAMALIYGVAKQRVLAEVLKQVELNLPYASGQ